MRIVLTIVGKDQVGIIAKASNLLASYNVNIVNINQNILEGFFNMVLIGDMTDSSTNIKEMKAAFNKISEELGLDIKVQHEEIFVAMHRI